MADLHISFFTHSGMLVQALPNLFTTILAGSTSEAINEVFDKTMRRVIPGKAYRVAAEREYKQLKRHFLWLGYGVEDARRMSNKLNNASLVYYNLEKVRDNLKSCPNVDIRRLTLK